MRKLGDEGPDRAGPREKEVTSAGESAREPLDRAVEKPLQKLIEKIVRSRTGKEIQARHIDDEKTR